MRRLSWGGQAAGVGGSRWHVGRAGAGWLALCLMLSTGAAEGEGGLRLSLTRLAHTLVTLEGASLTLAADGASGALRIDRLRIGEHVVSGVALHCGSLVLAPGRVGCRDGVVQLPGLLAQAQVRFDFEPGTGALALALDSPDGERLILDRLPDGRLQAVFSGLDLARLSGMLPGLGGVALAGRASGSITSDSLDHPAELALEVELTEVGFASDRGLNAGEGIALVVSGRFSRSATRWQGQLAARWTAGEAYVHPLYVVAPAAVDVSGHLEDAMLTIEAAQLSLDGVDRVTLEASIGLFPLAVGTARVALAGADLEVIGPRYLLPLIAPALTERVQFEGRVDLAASYASGRLVAMDAMLDAVSARLDSGRVGIGPISGAVPWHAFEPARARVTVAAANWEALSLAPFDIVARLQGDAITLDPLSMPLLDGRVVLSQLSLARQAEGWHGQGAAVIEPLSVSALTSAIGLPVMSGVLSAALPGFVIRPGALVFDGTMVMSVFNGYLRISRLELREPFGVGAYLTADVEARHLDLGQLTDTFAFGNMSGFIDADVLGLELAAWRPVSFDAMVRSSPGRYPRRISQRAVQNIGALGGGGAVLAMQRGFLGFFESFGYREIGWSCQLRDGVCTMGGIDDAPHDESFVIIRGGGIPALNVIGYNRRVDWQALLARLKAAIASNAELVIE